MPRTTAAQYVVAQLQKRGASLFEPVVGADDVDLAVRGGEGQYVEVRIVEANQGSSRRFAMGRFRPKGHVFFVCVAAEPEEAWVLPSSVFERFAGGAPGGDRLLDLDREELGEALSERLNVYKDRWVLIAEYAKYRSTLSDPVSLQMRIAMG